MIDLHTHILPRIDDGASSVEEALQMAELAAQDGISTIVATPHSPEMSGIRWTPNDIAQHVNSLQTAVSARGIPVSLDPGEEVYLSPGTVGRFESQEISGIAGGPYLLFEIPLLSFPSYTEALVFELQVRGARLVMAHPERNRAISESPNLVLPLVQKGVLMQLTAGSLTGAFGPEAMETARVLIEHNLGHIIASDAHSGDDRAPRLSLAVAAVAEWVGTERARAMVTTVPAAVLRGEEPCAEAPRMVTQRGRRWFWARSAGERK